VEKKEGYVALWLLLNEEGRKGEPKQSQEQRQKQSQVAKTIRSLQKDVKSVLAEAVEMEQLSKRKGGNLDMVEPPHQPNLPAHCAQRVVQSLKRP